MRALLTLLAAIAMVFGTTGAARAEDLTVTDYGWYRSIGVGNPGSSNFYTGDDGVTLLRGFIVVNVPAGPPVNSVSLRIFSHTVVNGPNTIEIFDVTTPLATLQGGAGGIPAYDDLGTGTIYGSHVFANSDVYEYISLNPQALLAVNALRGGGGGDLALGFVSTTMGGGLDGVFNNSSAPAADNALVVVLPVPTLSEWAMITLALMMGAVGIYVLHRRRAA